MAKDIKGIRKQIDIIDKKIVSLLDERATAVKNIAGLKIKNESGVYDPAREANVLNNIKKASKGKFPHRAIEAVYNEIFSASRDLQRKVRVAYFGAPASYTHLAAMKRFGSATEYIPAESIKDVFMEVEKGNVDYGVVPVENSTEGAVNYTFDMFADFDLKICSEVMLDIKHNLLSKAKHLKDIKVVYVHPQTRAQCRNWLEANLPHAELKEVSSNSKSAMLAAKDKKSAGIGDKLAASMYKLNIIASSIEDMTDNTTRFFILGKEESRKTGNDKTSIMVSIKDKVGALYNLLKPLSKYGINLTSIESRPSGKKAWDYYFFVDFTGYKDDFKVKKALAEVARECGFVKILGSYPKF